MPKLCFRAYYSGAPILKAFAQERQSTIPVATTKMTLMPEVRIWNFGNGTARAQVLPLVVPFAGPSMEADTSSALFMSNMNPGMHPDLRQS